MNPQTISENEEKNKIGSTKLSKDQLSQQRRKSRIEKMQSKNDRKATSQLDNILTSYVKGNNNVDNDIDFYMVEPIEEKKACFNPFLFLIEIMGYHKRCNLCLCYFT